jgi:hypothetical protein
MTSDQAPNDRRRQGRWVVALVVAAVVVVVAVLILARPSANTPAAREFDPTDFTPDPGVDVPADSVKGEVIAAIEQLAAEPFVRIVSVNFNSSSRADFDALVDVAGARMSYRETFSTGVEVGGPISSPIVAEMTIIADQGWIRVLQPGQDADTPYQLLDLTGLSEQNLLGAFTDRSRLFGSLQVLRQLVAEVPMEAQRLDAAELDDVELQRVRVTFRAPDVSAFLAVNNLETVGASGVPGATTFEFWFSADGLRSLVATGIQFQDGEAIPTSARVTYQPIDTLSIVAPTNVVG